MAKVRLDFGAELDVLTQDELNRSLAGYYDAVERARVRGVRYRRMPQLTGQVAAAAILLGATGGQVQAGPDSGLAWSVRRIYVSGLTAGATPDVVGLYINGTGGQPLWQISGNDPGDTFGRLELTLLGGETLVVANIGALTATGAITVSGELIELPQEMLGKLA